MGKLWNASTTVRNPKRLLGFLKVCQEIEGKHWNNKTQCDYQIRLIQNKLFIPNKVRHPYSRKASLTYEEAKEIFYSINYAIPDYGIRGRTSISPLEKLGFVNTNSGVVKITDIGRDFIAGRIDSSDAMDMQMQQWRFVKNGANVKPFVATLHLIEGINNLTKSRDGISFVEFGSFVMTINHYRDINKHIEYIDLYRRGRLESNSILSNYSNTHSYHDYLDNNMKYLRESNLLIVNNRIGLNYQNKTTIDHILQSDTGRAI